MDYLNYGNKVEKKPSQKFTALQNSARKQPQEFLTVKPKTSNVDLNQKVDMSIDDFRFGDLNRSDVDLRKPEKILEQHRNEHKPFFNEKTTTNQQTKEPVVYTNPKTGEKHAGLPTHVDEFGGELIQLFPIPVYITRYRNDYTNEMKFIYNAECIGTKDSEQKQIDNLYGKKNTNRQSLDNFILDNPELENIRKWIHLQINDYARNVMGSKSEMIITQSWLNKNGRGESHHEHAHPNSMISGVWYPQINENLPPIEFRTPIHRDISMQIETYNQFNSATFMLPMKMGELIMFPSNLSHSVQPNLSDEERISLSFNTWCKGSLGDKKSLTYLPLDRCV